MTLRRAGSTLAGLKGIEQVFINGHEEKRVPHNLNMSFNYVEGESLIMGIKGLAGIANRPAHCDGSSRHTDFA